MIDPEYKKITQALNYITRESMDGEINYMKALKLLYLAERLHLRKYGRLITNDHLVAMKKGTLGSQARDIAIQSEHLPYVVYQYSEDKLIRDVENYSIKVNNDEVDRLSETDVECLERICPGTAVIDKRFRCVHLYFDGVVFIECFEGSRNLFRSFRLCFQSTDKGALLQI